MIALKTIVVATDFGEASQAAFNYGRELARKFGATLHVFHVVDDAASRALALSAGVLPDLTTSQVEVEADARRRVETLLSDEDKRDLHAVAAVETSNTPASAIVAYGQRVHAELLVVGTHGRGPITHILLGNVAERVVRTAPCPVLTVRHPEHEFVLPDALQQVAAR